MGGGRPSLGLVFRRGVRLPLHLSHRQSHLRVWSVQSSRFHPGGNPGANLKSNSHKYYLEEVANVWELTKETIHLPLGCLQGGWSEPTGSARNPSSCWVRRLHWGWRATAIGRVGSVSAERGMGTLPLGGRRHRAVTTRTFPPHSVPPTSLRPTALPSCPRTPPTHDHRLGALVGRLPGEGR